MKHVFWILALAFAWSGCGGGYRRTAAGITYLGWNESEGMFEYLIPGADPASFKALDKLYARDTDRVYFAGHVVTEAEPDSFVLLGGVYGRDRLHVFLKETVVTGADPTTFQVLDQNLFWGRDATHVFFGPTAEPAVDAAHFRIVRPHWGCDGRAYYTDIGVGISHRVEADYASLQILNTHYAKDRREAFYGVEPIPGADVATFVVVDDITARDARATYVLGRRQAPAP